MIYDKRNRANIDKLAYHTKQKALQWYEFCVKNNINILIYETIRDVKTQRENVKKGVSQTMKSYHLVGQALDFVPVNSKGQALWNGYNSKDIQKAIKEAKRLGFEWGGDWRDFKDKPHLQYNYKGYGTDTFTKPKNEHVSNNGTVDIDDLVKRTIRGEFGNGEERKRKLGKYYDEVQSIINGKKQNDSVNIDDLVKRTIRGEFGNGAERKKKLGKYYNEVQKRVNKYYE